MLAMNYRGPQRVRIDHKPVPEILHPRDAIVRVTRSCICGSDLHLYNGSVPDTRVGMTFGHEVTGVVEEVGPAVEKLKVGDHLDGGRRGDRRRRGRGHGELVADDARQEAVDVGRVGHGAGS